MLRTSEGIVPQFLRMMTALTDTSSPELPHSLNQQRVFKFAGACLTQTERVSDDVTRKIGPLDFTKHFITLLNTDKSNVQ